MSTLTKDAVLVSLKDMFAVHSKRAKDSYDDDGYRSSNKDSNSLKHFSDETRLSVDLYNTIEKVSIGIFIGNERTDDLKELFSRFSKVWKASEEDGAKSQSPAVIERFREDSRVAAKTCVKLASNIFEI